MHLEAVMLTLNSPQKDLDLGVQYYFNRILDNIDQKVLTAMAAIEKLEALANMDFNHASFEKALKAQYENHAETIGSKPDLLAKIAYYLPVYPDSNVHHFFSENDDLNMLLIDKIFEHEEWVVKTDALSMIGHKLDRLNKPDSLCKLLEYILTEEYADTRFFTADDCLIAPLLRMSQDSELTRNFLIKYENQLVEIVNNHRNFLDSSSYYLSGINIKHADCIKFIEFGVPKLAKVVFKKSMAELTGAEPIDIFTKFAERLGERIVFTDHFLYRTFAAFHNDSNPYRGDVFKYFAHAHIHSEFARLPFSPDQSINDLGASLNPKNGKYLNRVSFINGLNKAIELTGEDNANAINQLIHRLKEIVGQSDVRAEIARQIPASYLIDHPDLNRQRLSDDLSL
jgi:hypothetical protein